MTTHFGGEHEVNFKTRRLGPISVLISLAIVFIGIGTVIYHYLYSEGAPVVLIAVAIFLMVGLESLIALLFVVNEQKKSTKTFYPINENKGTPEVQAFAQKLDTHFEGTQYLIETNSEGIRI